MIPASVRTNRYDLKISHKIPPFQNPHQYPIRKTIPKFDPQILDKAHLHSID